jgi:hypothetical protein
VSGDEPAEVRHKHVLIGLSIGSRTATWHCSCGVTGVTERDPAVAGEDLFEKTRSYQRRHARQNGAKIIGATQQPPGARS